MNKETKCWSCKNANGKCSWSKNFQPVEGWTAIKTIIPSDNEESYLVYKCPNYVLDKTMLSVEQISKILHISIRSFYKLGEQKVLMRLQKLHYDVILTNENKFILRGLQNER